MSDQPTLLKVIEENEYIHNIRPDPVTKLRPIYERLLTVVGEMPHALKTFENWQKDHEPNCYRCRLEKILGGDKK
jgi:hypothetical protein